MLAAGNRPEAAGCSPKVPYRSGPVAGQVFLFKYCRFVTHRSPPPPTLTGQWEEDKRQGLGVFKVSPILQCGVRGAPSPRARVRATAPWAVRAHAERAVGLQSHCD